MTTARDGGKVRITLPDGRRVWRVRDPAVELAKLVAAQAADMRHRFSVHDELQMFRDDEGRRLRTLPLHVTFELTTSAWDDPVFEKVWSGIEEAAAYAQY